MKNILMDVDSVVADLMPEWLLRYNLEYKDILKPSNITAWDIHQLVKPECGKKIYQYLWDENLYNNVKPIDGALSGIQWLRACDYRVVFVTSGIQPAKIKWLYEHGFLTGTIWQSDKDVVVASDKSLIKGDYLVDDNMDNCKKFHATSILFAQPWNYNDSAMTRVNSWADLIFYFSKKVNV